jgi:hypothetical protein
MAAQLFNITLVGAAQLKVNLGLMPATCVAALEVKIRQLQINLAKYIRESKLSGQVLNVRTGNLRRSVFEGPTVTSGNVVTGAVLQSGDVKYGRFWEFGFTGDETVKQHVRTMVFGRTVAPFSVGPYTRHVNASPHSFMRSGLADQADTITLEIKRAAVQALLNTARGTA